MWDFFFFLLRKMWYFPTAHLRKAFKIFIMKNLQKLPLIFPFLCLYTACKSDVIITSEELERAYLSPWESYEDDSSVLQQCQSCYIFIH